MEASRYDDDSSKPALAVAAVGHSYAGRRALDGVSFEIPAGRFAVLLGLNGAGKSTLFALITRLYDAREGRIEVFGHVVSREPGEALRRLGVVFQSRTLDLDLSVLQNLTYHAALHGMAGADGRRRAIEILERFDLSDRKQDKVRSLSGGQMRRIEIGRALLHRPQLLLLDEATVGLDIRSRAEIIGHVRGLVANEGIGVLWATHLIEEVTAQDLVIVLHNGRVLAAGPVGEIVSMTGGRDIKSAFASLTGADRPHSEAA
ncbi:MAG: ATP-binding cassette domain-containing protein [Pseudomonadota bacterium]|nr:ATP-binding cassette domain-containing protein [Pseudomonadota bacterium]